MTFLEAALILWTEEKYVCDFKVTDENYDW